MNTKLFCIPYAGGSASIFSRWKEHLCPGIELESIELAGRGARFFEPHYENKQQAVEDILQSIGHKLVAGPYMLFGHSMGALLAYEIAQKIREMKLPRPFHIFLSGTSAPHLRDRNKSYHLLSDEKFKKKISHLGGTPKEFFQNPELLEIFLPILKNDFRLVENCLIDNEIRPLDENITTFFGNDDKLTKAQTEGWKVYTRASYSIHYFKGGHFFLINEKEKMIHIINKCYKQFIEQLGSKSS